MISTKVILDALDDEIKVQTKASIEEAMQAIEKKRAEVIKGLEPLQQLEVTYNEQANKVTGLQHKQLKELIKIVAQNLPVMMVGSAGSGKTKAAEQVAEALGFSFHCQSVGAQTSKSDLFGFVDASGKYQSSGFRKAYEKGGVFCMDEIDAGNPNVLVLLNSAIANGCCAFPDKMVKVHKDFRFIGTANTYGTGTNRMYVGRNQLDMATLDRFVVIEWAIDEDLEKQLAGNTKLAQAWVRLVQTVRAKAQKQKLRAVISPRATMKGAALLALAIDEKKVYEMVISPMVGKTKGFAWNDMRDEFRGALEAINNENLLEAVNF